jgi:hypothetical protein
LMTTSPAIVRSRARYTSPMSPGRWVQRSRRARVSCRQRATCAGFN